MSDNNEKRDLELRQWTLESSIEHFKKQIANAEAELVKIADTLKGFAATATETVQQKAEDVVEQAAEVVETVKEEVKKAAPKKSTKKAAAKAEETPAEVEEAPAEEAAADDSDK